MKKILYIFFISRIAISASMYAMYEPPLKKIKSETQEKEPAVTLQTLYSNDIRLSLNCENFDDLVAYGASLLERLAGQEQGGNYCSPLSRAETVLYTKKDIIFEKGALINQYGCEPTTVSFIRSICNKHSDRHSLIIALVGCNFDEVRKICKKNPYVVNAYALYPEYGGVAAPLHYALYRYASSNEQDRAILTRCIGYLLHARACVDAADYNGDTPLHKSSTKDQLKLLWRNGADKDRKNNLGITPAMTYVLNGREDLALFLVTFGGALTALRDNNGNLLLHHAIRANHAQLSDMLLCDGKQFEINNQCFGAASSCMFTIANVVQETPVGLAQGATKDVQKVMQYHILSYLCDAFHKECFYLICMIIGKYDWIDYHSFFDWAKDTHKNHFSALQKACGNYKDTYPNLAKYVAANK